jgi:hypothetical protein
MAHNLFTGTQTVLQHISEILHSPFVVVSKHHYGKRVKVVENYGDYSIVTIGKICGVEYFNHPDIESGFFYQISNESGYLLYKDGTKQEFDFDKMETVNEENIHSF